METQPIATAAVPGMFPVTELYLHTMEELSLQLEQAMQAIVARSLSAFEENVSRQRRTCAQLLALPRYSGPDHDSGCANSESSVDADLTDRIAAAREALQTLNKRYSALLGHTGETMRLLARLRGGYDVSTMAGSVSFPAGRSTWSCEV